MLIHAHRSLNENLASVAGTLEKHRGLGLTIPVEAMPEVERRLHILIEQASQLSDSRAQLEVDSDLAGAVLLELPPQSETDGPLSRRLEWAMQQLTQLASELGKVGYTAKATQLRYIAGHLYLAGEAVEKLEDAPPLRPVSLKGRALRLVLGGLAS